MTEKRFLEIIYLINELQLKLNTGLITFGEWEESINKLRKELGFETINIVRDDLKFLFSTGPAMSVRELLGIKIK